jgi:hypothetical protein
MVDMLYKFGIFVAVETYDLLFSFVDKFSVSYALNIEDHVSTKQKLSWITLKTGVKG